MSEPINPEYLLIGRIYRPHGVRGELRVEILTEMPERFTWLDELYLSKKEAGTPKPYPLESVRFHKGLALVKLSGYDGREAVESFRGHYVKVPYSEAIPVEEGEFFLHQLLNMQVVISDGRELGRVKDLIQTGANEVFVVDSPQFGEVLIPDTEEVVTHIDGTTRTITVNLIPGLIPELDANDAANHGQ